MKCSVRGCERDAVVKVMLYDVYPHEAGADILFLEQDCTCPFLCAQHVAENEVKAKGTRKPRGEVYYPFSNRHMAQGFTIYFPLDKEKQEALLELVQVEADGLVSQN
jgi:hypothetical protein